MNDSPDTCAEAVLEIVPLVMRAIRGEMRRQRTPDLSVPQFRTLAFLRQQPGASLSEVAGHIGLTLPSMSKLIDGLVARRLVTRQAAPGDRRRVTLELTGAGQAAFDTARTATRTYLARRLATLPAADRASVVQAMQLLRSSFTAAHELVAGEPLPPAGEEAAVGA